MNIRISWSAGPEFPHLVKGGAMGIVGDTIVHAGGMTFPWRESETGWWLGPGKDDWEPLPPLPVGRAYTSGASCGDEFFVLAGRRRGLPLCDGYRLTRKGEKWHWDDLPHMNYPRGVPAVACEGSSIYAVGGGSWGRGAFLPDDVPGDEMIRLDRLEEGWVEISPCPGRRRADASAAALGGKLYIFGGAYAWKEGEEQKIARLNDAWCYDARTQKWTELPGLPCAGLSGAAAVVFEDRFIILLGGAIPTTEQGPDATITYRQDEGRGIKVGWYNETIFVYDIEEGEYATVDDGLPWGTHDVQAVILGNTIHAVGGENVDASTSNTCAQVRVGKVEART
jgi:N-acetylneuraminic acid mutarotase